MVRFYFLPRFYCWRLSCYDLSTEVSSGKGRVSHSHSLGPVPHLDYIMLRLPWLVRSRFCLGLLESGISPMFMLIVGGFYKKNEQAMRMG